MTVVKWLDKNFEFACLAMILAIMTLLSFTNVIMRYCFHSALSWSDELCCYCLAISAFLALSASIRHKSQIRMDTITVLLSKQAQKGIGILCDIMMLAFTMLCAKGTLDLFTKTLETNQKSPALQIPVANLYGIMGFCFALSTFRVLQSLALTCIVTGGENEKKEEKAV